VEGPLKTREEIRAYHAEWRRKNREHVLAYAAQQRQRNRETYRENHRRCVEKNPERDRQSKKKWLLKNGEAYHPRAMALQKARYHSNPEIRVKSIANAKKHQLKNPERTTYLKRATLLRWKYGLTPEAWDEMFERQGRACASCRSDTSKGKRFHTDHCHKTNKVRGILCHHCNLMIGHAKDNVRTLEAAIEYLKRGE
jgi:hypothetical protein